MTSQKDVFAKAVFVIFFLAIGTGLFLSAQEPSVDAMSFSTFTEYQDSLSAHILVSGLSLSDVLWLQEAVDEELWFSTDVREALLVEAFTRAHQQEIDVEVVVQLSPELQIVMQDLLDGVYSLDDIYALAAEHAPSLTYEDAIILLTELAGTEWVSSADLHTLTTTLISDNIDFIIGLVVLYGDDIVSEELLQAAIELLGLESQETASEETQEDTQEETSEGDEQETQEDTQEDGEQETKEETTEGEQESQTPQEQAEERVRRGGGPGTHHSPPQTTLSQTVTSSEAVLHAETDLDAQCRYSLTRTIFLEKTPFSHTGNTTHQHTFPVGTQEVFVRCRNEETNMVSAMQTLTFDDAPPLTPEEPEPVLAEPMSVVFEGSAGLGVLLVNVTFPSTAQQDLAVRSAATPSIRDREVLSSWTIHTQNSFSDAQMVVEIANVYSQEVFVYGQYNNNWRELRDVSVSEERIVATDQATSHLAIATRAPEPQPVPEPVQEPALVQEEVEQEDGVLGSFLAVFLVFVSFGLLGTGGYLVAKKPKKIVLKKEGKKGKK